MSFETNIKDIKKLITVLTGKDTEVFITYRGASYGISNPWHIRCDAREAVGITHDEAANTLLSNLKAELNNKIVSAENQVEQYKSALSAVDKTYQVLKIEKIESPEDGDDSAQTTPILASSWQNN